MKHHARCAVLSLAALVILSAPRLHAAEPWRPVAGHLMTRWAAQVSPQNALPDYPRPQMTRKNWQSLNGAWQFAEAGDTDQPPVGRELANTILVPFPTESALSGVGRHISRAWYRRTFTVPNAWKGQNVLLHFGAVNYASTVWVNGKQQGEHQGGYDPFSFDVTPALRAGQNEILVSVSNPVDEPGGQVIGKQRLNPSGIFYTPATGIWQSVWLEPVPATSIDNLKMTPDVDASTLRLTIKTAGTTPSTVRIEALDGGKRVANLTGKANVELRIPVANPHLWTPDDPYLYTLRVSLLNGNKTVDSVDSYFAMRKISLGKDPQGRTRLLLNNKLVFQAGALDQGYWPDGIYTAPTDEALRYDIEAAKKLGFNLLRKHAKVEPARWYYWTDKLGMLVWQDMPQGYNANPSPATKQQFITELNELIADHYNSPSIVVWTLFNEGWGQHDTETLTPYLQNLDKSRLVNSASGWTDKGVGDIDDTHHYPPPWANMPSATRAAVNGEFGGLGMRIEGHMWQDKSWGYQGLFSRNRQLTQQYQNYLKQVYDLVNSRGMSAMVYTQLTDVEGESNGLLTYDRAVFKPDVNIVHEANQGRFPALPPDPNPPLLPTSQDAPANWRYTFAKPADDWMQPTFSDAAWQIGQSSFGKGVGDARTPWTTSDIWLRRQVTLPANLPAKLSFLVFHDEDIEIYVNGVLAAQVPGYSTDYVSVPLNAAGRAALKPGVNTLAMHVKQTAGGQYVDLGMVADDAQ